MQLACVNDSYNLYDTIQDAQKCFYIDFFWILSDLFYLFVAQAIFHQLAPF